METELYRNFAKRRGRGGGACGKGMEGMMTFYVYIYINAHKDISGRDGSVGMNGSPATYVLLLYERVRNEHQIFMR